MASLLAGLGRWFGYQGQADLELGELVLLPGPWPWGVALGMHSADEDAQGDTRTEIGALLARFKYGGERHLAGLLGRALAEAVQRWPGWQDLEVLVHIPSAQRRHYESACELARVAAKALGIGCLPRLIARTRQMAAQKDLTRWQEKRKNVEGAFRVRRADLVRGKKLLLVDDVYDSGATVEECWRLLHEAGAAEVAVATVTKTRFRRDHA
jgi:predicted amidophosphoribosyltransferase